MNERRDVSSETLLKRASNLTEHSPGVEDICSLKTNHAIDTSETERAQSQRHGCIYSDIS